MELHFKSRPSLKEWQIAEGKCVSRAFCRKFMVCMLWDTHWLDGDFATGIKYITYLYLECFSGYTGRKYLLPFQKICNFGQQWLLWLNTECFLCDLSFIFWFPLLIKNPFTLVFCNSQVECWSQFIHVVHPDKT